METVHAELAKRIAAAASNDATYDVEWDTITSLWPDETFHPDDRLIRLHKLAAQCKARANVERGVRVRFSRAPRPYNAFERVERVLRDVEALEMSAVRTLR